MTSAARRASLASSIVQQPRAPERYDCGLRDRARWMPVTSCPASAARAAATAESTPPDIAASTFTTPPPRCRITAPAARARCTAGPIASMTRRTSSAVDVCPSEKRSDERAAASSQPIASRTCDACGTPAEHAEPVEHSMPCASSSIRSESPSQPGNERWALPGSRNASSTGPLRTASGTMSRIPRTS